MRRRQTQAEIRENRLEQIRYEDENAISAVLRCSLTSRNEKFVEAAITEIGTAVRDYRRRWLRSKSKKR